jgi:hypothetical protein
MTLAKQLMKPLAYYQTTSVSIPKKDDYMTIFYYRKGVMVGMKVGKIEDDFKPPKNCVEEKVLDELSYNAHLKHYYEEQDRLKNEFQTDLIAEYDMTNHPKANKIFDKSWELGKGNYEEVEYYFQDLVELFNENISYKN